MNKSIIPINEDQIQRDIESIGIKTIELFDTSKLTINPLDCEKSLLPHLALALDVNIDGLDEDEQRAYLQNAREIKKYAGSVYAVRTAASSIFKDVKLLQWFDYGGVPNRFKLDISAYKKEVSLDNIQKVRRLVEDAKRKSSHLDSIELSYVNQLELTSCASNMGETKSSSNMVDGYTNIAAGLAVVHTHAVYESSCDTQFSLNFVYTPKDEELENEDKPLLPNVGYMETLSALTSISSSCHAGVIATASNLIQEV